MSGIAIFSGSFCGAEAVVRGLVTHTGYRPMSDEWLVAQAAEASGMPEEKIRRAFSARTSIFNPFTHEKEYSIASLRMALATELKKGPVVVHGFCAPLIPRTLRQVLRVGITASMPFRLERAQTKHALDEEAASARIQAEDADRVAWTETLFGAIDPWDRSLHATVISMDQMDRQAAVLRIVADREEGTAGSVETQRDFLLAATVEMALYRAGHDVSVAAEGGHVMLNIHKQVLMRTRLEEELRTLTGALDGVQSVSIAVGEPTNPVQMYRKHDLASPSRVLLVDDEREFVQTLCERLQLRDMGVAITFDGASALTMVDEDEPDVMILDLKMPGMDGMKVLASAKQMRPEIEVIVLTGHGNESDRKRCMELGAFAYMQKPVDMEMLSATLKKAHEKIRKRKPEEGLASHRIVNRH